MATYILASFPGFPDSNRMREPGTSINGIINEIHCQLIVFVTMLSLEKISLS